MYGSRERDAEIGGRKVTFVVRSRRRRETRFLSRLSFAGRTGQSKYGTFRTNRTSTGN